jgi:tight adherence protein B
MENALREALKDVELLYGKETILRKELYYMVRQLDMNVSMEAVLQGFAKRVPQEDVESFVTIFSTAGKYGGDSIGVIQNSVKILCDKMEVRQEIQILTAAKQFEFKVMTIIPLGIILYMRMAFGDFMNALYGNLPGVFIMSICLAIYMGAWMYGKKITVIDL